MSLQTSDQTSITAGDWLRVRRGEPLEVYSQADVPHAGGGANLQLHASIGDLKIDVPAAPLTCHFAYTSPSEREVDSPTDQDVGIEAALQLPLHLSRVETLSRFFPKWSALTGPAVVAGDLDLEGRIEFIHRPDELLLAAHLQFLADSLELRYLNRLHKAAGQPMRLELEHRLALSKQGREQAARIDLNLKPLRVAANIAFAGLESQDLSDDFEQVQVTVEIQDAAEVLDMLPEFADAFPQLQAHGRCRLQIEDLLVGEHQTLTVHADATHTDLLIDSKSPFYKRAGMPAVCDLAWSGESDPAGPSLQNWELRRGRIELGGWRTTDLSGHVVIAVPGARGQGFIPGVRSASINRALHAARGERVFRAARLKSAGSLKFDPSLAYVNDFVRRLFNAYRLSGECTYELEVNASPEQVTASGTLGGDRAGFSVDLDNPHVPMFRKPAGAPAEVNFLVEASREADRSFQVRVREADLVLPGMNASVDGVLSLDPAGPQPALGELDLTARLHLLNAQALTSLLPASDLHFQAGACTASARLTAGTTGFTIDAAHLDLNHLLLRTPAEALSLDGVLMGNQQHLRVDELKVRWGGLDAILSGDVEFLQNGAAGRIAIAVDQLDLPALQERLRRPNGTSAEDAPPADTGHLLRQVFDYLRGCELTISAQVGRLDFNLPLAPISVDALSMRADVRENSVELTFHCLVEGGYVTGRCAVDLRQPDAPFHLTYTADQLQPGRLVDRYLSLTFPGMKATGPLTLIDETHQKFLPRPAELNYPVGKGEMFIAGGTIEGRAAPEWMARIFPGLNLSSFEFSYMHSWFTKTIDGRIRHQMIYQGRFYNIYAVGTGDTEGRIDYEVGLDFLADFDSQYWAESGQGRIPLFRKTGVKAPDGSLQDEVVTYTPPQRILDTLLVKNNPLVTAYHAVRKRVLREQ